jgi:hypothetical protein
MPLVLFLFLPPLLSQMALPSSLIAGRSLQTVDLHQVNLDKAAILQDSL